MTSDELRDKYIQRYSEMHETTKDGAQFDGHQFYRKFAKIFANIFKSTPRDQAISLLDYGCGKAKYMWKKFEGEDKSSPDFVAFARGKLKMIWLYDPAYKPYSDKPPAGLTFDIVTCADVMEHIPEPVIDEVLNDIASYTKPEGLMMFSISGQLAVRTFPDGENCHCSVFPIEWWIEKLDKLNRSYILYHTDDRRKKQVEKVVGNINSSNILNRMLELVKQLESKS